MLPCMRVMEVAVIAEKHTFFSNVANILTSKSRLTASFTTFVK